VNRYPRLTAVARTWRDWAAPIAPHLAGASLYRVEVLLRRLVDHVRCKVALAHALPNPRLGTPDAILAALTEQQGCDALTEATLVGAERGRRIGAQAAKRLRLEANQFGKNSTRRALLDAGWSETDFAESEGQGLPDGAAGARRKLT
jgi:hypothetical protein